MRTPCVRDKDKISSGAVFERALAGLCFRGVILASRLYSAVVFRAVYPCSRASSSVQQTFDVIKGFCVINAYCSWYAWLLSCLRVLCVVVDKQCG